jgi:hypothetical protein
VRSASVKILSFQDWFRFGKTENEENAGHVASILNAMAKFFDGAEITGTP